MWSLLLRCGLIALVSMVASARAEERAPVEGREAPPLPASAFDGGSPAPALEGRPHVRVFVSAAADPADPALAVVRRAFDGVRSNAFAAVAVHGGDAGAIARSRELLGANIPVVPDLDGRHRSAHGLAPASPAIAAAIVAPDGRISWIGEAGTRFSSTLTGWLTAPGGYPADLVRRSPRWADVEERVADLGKTPVFALHARAREIAAATGDGRAMGMLVRSYTSAEEPREFVRSTIVSAAAVFLWSPSHDAAWNAWLSSNANRDDAWLWHRRAWMRAPFDDGAAAVSGASAPDPWIAAASFRGIENAAADAALSASRDRLARLPARGLPRQLMLEAVTRVVGAHGRSGATELVADCCSSLADQLDSRETSLRSRSLISSALGRALEVDMDSTESAAWRAEIANWRLRRAQPPEPSTAPSYGANRSYFFGTPVRGARVVYVIDASDSMLDPISGDVLEQRRRAVTGRPGENSWAGVDWSQVNTRFDLVREVVRVSVERLPAGARFSVVLFGDKAETLDATPSLVPASRTVAREVADELGRLASAATKTRRLRGDTNVHGAMRVAFSLTSSARRDAGFTSPRMLDEGCDAIYVLSDGDPNTDDFIRSHKRDVEDACRAPNDGGQVADTPTVSYSGPFCRMRGARGAYAEGDEFGTGPCYLLEDVARMNLFRQATIHCVAFEGGDPHLAEGLAQIGGGTVCILK